MPLWDAGTLIAVCLVKIIHFHHLLPIAALLEQIVSLLLVKRATHPVICGMSSEDCRAAHSLALPYALLYHA